MTKFLVRLAASALFCMHFCEAPAQMSKQLKLCEVLLEQGATGRAKAYLKKIEKDPGINAKPKIYARVLNAIGDCYFDEERIEVAYTYYRQSEQLFAAHKDSVLLAATWLKVGNCYKDILNPDAARSYYDRVFSFSKRRKQIELQVKALLNRAGLEGNGENYEEAGEYLKRALNLVKRSNNYYLRTQARLLLAHNMLSLLEQQGESLDLELAVRQYESVAYMAKSRGFRSLQAEAALMIGYCKWKMKKLKTAFVWTRRAERLFKGILDKDHPSFTRVFSQIASIESSRKKFAEAETFIGKAIQAGKKHYSYPHPNLWRHFYDASLITYGTSVDRAICFLDSALLCCQITSDGEFQNDRFGWGRPPLEGLELLLMKANMLAETNPEASIPLLQKLLPLTQLWLQYYTLPKTRKEFQEKIHIACQIAVRICWRAYQLQSNKAYIEQGFLFAEYSKYASLAEAVRRRVLQGNERLINNRLDSLERVLDGLLRRSDLSNPLNQEAIRSAKTSLEATRRAWLATPYSQDIAKDAPLTNLSGIIQSLEMNQVFVSYFQGEGDYVYAFVLSPSAAPSFHRLQCHIKECEVWKSLLVRNADNNRDSFYVYGKSLYDALVAPLNLPGDATLLLSPDASLSGLPFEALIRTHQAYSAIRGWNQMPYWLPEKGIAYQPSAALWLLLKKQAKLSRRISFLGIMPDFSKEDASCRLGALRNDHSYINKIINYLQSRLLYSDTLKGFVTKGRTLEAFNKGYDIVHISSHGAGNIVDGAASCIFFNRKPTDDCKEGQLQGWELSGIDMQKTKLLTFSVCSTNAGEQAAGEGVICMAYAFAKAGVSNMVTTLYEAEESASDKMFDVFYESFSGGGLKTSDALHLAKKKMIEFENTAAPSNWAPFICFGPGISLPHTPELAGETLGMGLFVLLLLAAGIIFYYQKHKPCAERESAD